MVADAGGSLVFPVLLLLHCAILYAANPPETVTQNIAADIVYANGNFVQYPDPTQPPR